MLSKESGRENVAGHVFFRLIWIVIGLLVFIKRHLILDITPQICDLCTFFENSKMFTSVSTNSTENGHLPSRRKQTVFENSSLIVLRCSLRLFHILWSIFFTFGRIFSVFWPFVIFVCLLRLRLFCVCVLPFSRLLPYLCICNFVCLICNTSRTGVLSYSSVTRHAQVC